MGGDWEGNWLVRVLSQPNQQNFSQPLTKYLAYFVLEKSKR